MRSFKVGEWDRADKRSEQSGLHGDDSAKQIAWRLAVVSFQAFSLRLALALRWEEPFLLAS